MIDPSSHIVEHEDTGALNNLMEKRNTIDVPRTFYATAKRRHWTHIWNVRIFHPLAEILLYKDNINSVFHRVQYHPDVTAAHAYTWSDYLFIAIGLIFGGRYSPGWFCLLYELRSDIAANYNGLQEAPPHHLVIKITVLPPLSAAEAHDFLLAQADAINPDTSSTAGTPMYHATFVDDNLMAEITNRIQLFIQRSSDSSYLLFSHLQRDILTPCLAEENFIITTLWCMNQLGLDTNTRNMKVI